MTSPADDDRRARVSVEPPIWEDTGILLYGVLLIVSGFLGMTYGRTVIVIPGGQNTGSRLTWVVSGTGVEVVSVGLLTLGIALIGRWRWGEWTRWSTRCGVAGSAILMVGFLVLGLASLSA